MTRNQLPNDPKARHAFEEAFFRIKIFQVASRLWDRVFTVSERELLGGDVEAAFRKYQTCGMWMQLRGVSKNRAVLDVAREVNALSEMDYHWLLREIGETADTGLPDRPHWNHAEGKLYFRKKMIRRVRVMRKPTNVQKILDAFQASSWNSRIANPLPSDPQQLHQALRSLNCKLKKIRFHSLEGGHAIRWEPTSQ